jgi:hypothetical protein
MIDAALAGIGLCQMPLAMLRQHIESAQLVTAHRLPKRAFLKSATPHLRRESEMPVFRL